ncbi:Hypothetical predicted protein [Xyrichtys novacula]|uniref:Uncharacterized protein n=1 Tax=Xyrichtys novacula TaxID=13765 RepID=A0AAV1GYN3_XYRNO|nr:Hypothetical predicted protein [Xyrichtys novacula]
MLSTRQVSSGACEQGQGLEIGDGEWSCHPCLKEEMISALMAAAECLFAAVCALNKLK